MPAPQITQRIGPFPANVPCSPSHTPCLHLLQNRSVNRKRRNALSHIRHGTQNPAFILNSSFLFGSYGLRSVCVGISLCLSGEVDGKMVHLKRNAWLGAGTSRRAAGYPHRRPSFERAQGYMWLIAFQLHSSLSTFFSDTTYQRQEQGISVGGRPRHCGPAADFSRMRMVFDAHNNFPRFRVRAGWSADGRNETDSQR